MFLKQPRILAYLCHKSEVTSQIDSKRASNSKLKPNLCNCIKIEIIDLLAILRDGLDRVLFLDILKVTFDPIEWC